MIDTISIYFISKVVTTSFLNIFIIYLYIRLIYYKVMPT